MTAALQAAARLGSATVADPRSDIRAGIANAVLFFVVLLGWAMFARLDAAASAPGTLEVSGQRQTVQHRDGGVVGRIFVREGERVTKGQLLISLAAAEVAAQERGLASQAIRLLAQRARLEAEEAGRHVVTPPPEFADLRPDERAEADTALRLQQTELNARAAVLAAQRNALGQRVAQSSEQGRGYEHQSVAAKEQLRLIDKQIAALRPVAEKGFVSQTRMRELERSRAELVGQQGQYAASVAETKGASRESEIQSLEATQSFEQDVASDLRQVEITLGTYCQSWRRRATSSPAPRSGRRRRAPWWA